MIIQSHPHPILKPDIFTAESFPSWNGKREYDDVDALMKRQDKPQYVRNEIHLSKQHHVLHVIKIMLKWWTRTERTQTQIRTSR